MITVDEHILKKYHPLLISMSSLAGFANIVLLSHRVHMNRWISMSGTLFPVSISILCITAYIASIYFNCRENNKVNLLMLAGDIAMTIIWVSFATDIIFNIFAISVALVVWAIFVYFIYWHIALFVEFCSSVWTLPISRLYRMNLIFLFTIVIGIWFSYPFIFKLKRNDAGEYFLFCVLFSFATGIASTLCVSRKTTEHIIPPANEAEQNK